NLVEKTRHRGSGAEKRLPGRILAGTAQELVSQLVALTLETAPLEHLVERQEDALEGQGFLEKIVCAALDGLDRRVHRAVPRDHNDGRPEACRAQPVEHGEAVEIRQPDVEKDRVGAEPLLAEGTRERVLSEADRVDVI